MSLIFRSLDAAGRRTIGVQLTPFDDSQQFPTGLGGTITCSSLRVPSTGYSTASVSDKSRAAPFGVESQFQSAELRLSAAFVSSVRSSICAIPDPTSPEEAVHSASGREGKSPVNTEDSDQSSRRRGRVRRIWRRQCRRASPPPSHDDGALPFAVTVDNTCLTIPIGATRRSPRAPS